MGNSDVTRRDFLIGTAATCGAMLIGEVLPGMPSAAGAAGGAPIPPITLTYYSNWQEIVEFFKKAAEDFRKVGLTPNLNPVVSSTVVPRTYAEHEKFYGDIGSIAWGATPDRLEPNFYLQTMLHSSFSKIGERNYGHYRSAKFDAACDAQKKEMDPEKRVKLVWEAQAIAAADYPIWWLAYPPLISAYNKRDFEGAVEMMGSGYGQVYSMWSYLKIRPRTARKTLRSGTQVDYITTLNPFTAATSPNQCFLRFFYDTFALIGPDLKAHPWAAESWKVLNPKTIDVVLRKGMKFHDGRPVTGEDFRFTFDYLKKWDFPFFRHAMTVIEKIEVNGMNIRFYLVEPYAPFIFTVLTWLFILPKHIWEKIPESVGVKHPGDYQNPNPIGSGPFRFGYFRKGQEAYFKANKDHFAAPAVDDVYFVIIPSADGVAGALERGEIDINQVSLTPALADRLQELPFMQVAYAPTHMVYEARPNIDKKPFDDVNFRKAIYHTFDRRPFVNYFAGKAIEGRNTPFTPLMKPWHNPNLPAPEYSIDKAKDVLRNSGYTWNSEGKLCFPAK
jgi:peptide/nickel transport system substrate-binding protein